ncbi:MAG TPA: hypothetical protein VD788_12700, partial [Candidatus Polarisedimenticolaceae bacterium]|nr:hypothetical protein [Candidatus Polarisedimenticolaceae bacterium]
GSVDYAAQPVAAYLDRPIYYPESESFGTFIDWGPARRHVPHSEVIRQAAALFDRRGREIVLILNYRPGGVTLDRTVAVGAGLRMRCFAELTGAIVADENYHLCRLWRPGDRHRGVDSDAAATDNDRGLENER